MSDLSTIRTMQELERQRALLQLKASREEQQIRRDVEAIKSDYMPVVNTVNGIRNSFSTLRTVTLIALPILRFFWNRRKRKR